MTADPTIIEAAARAIYDFDSYPMSWSNETEEKLHDYRELATTVLAAVTPMIRAATLEEAAKVAEDYGKRWTFVPAIIEVEAIATAIRALREQP